jgi:antitoxin (DNA-binding transcriptional repressor) of toxin-antitoxin stability system
VQLPTECDLDPLADVTQLCVTMKTTNIRELKHATSTVLDWVARGETVQITRYNKVVVVLSPPVREALNKPVRPDYGARLQRILGDRVLPSTGTELMDYDRGER